VNTQVAREKDGAAASRGTRRWRGLVAVTLATGFLALGGGIGANATGATTASSKPFDLIMIPKNTANPFFSAIAHGMDEAAEALHGGFQYYGTVEPDVPGQVALIRSSTAKAPTVIALSANDPTAPCPAFKAAQADGIKTVTYDADVSASCRTLFIQDASNENIGGEQLGILGKAMNYKGTFAVISAETTAANQNAWIAVIKSLLRTPQYQNMKLVQILYGNDDTTTSYQDAVTLLDEYPSLNGILAITPVGLDAAAKVLETQHKVGTIKLSGLGFPPDDASLLTTGVVPAYVLYNPVLIGYLTYYASYDLAQGVITGKAGQSFTAGKLGKFTIGPEGTILSGNAVIFTRQNVKNYLATYFATSWHDINPS